MSQWILTPWAPKAELVPSLLLLLFLVIVAQHVCPHGSLDHQGQFASDSSPITISTPFYTHSLFIGEGK